MAAYLKRLVSSLAAYQLADVVSRVIAVLLLPVYTRYIDPAGYGVVELLANGVILISIVVRLGMIEAFLRFYFSDEDQARRDALARRTAGFLLVATTIGAVALAPAAGPLSRSCSAIATPRPSGSRCSGCGRSPTSSSPTPCCASTSGCGCTPWRRSATCC